MKNHPILHNRRVYHALFLLFSKPKLLDNQLSVLSNFPIHPTTPSAPNIEVIDASDNDDDEVEHHR